MSSSIHDHNNEQMAELLFSIEKRTTPALIIAEIENYSLKEYIANRIKHESSEQFEHHYLDVSKISDTSLAEYLLHTTKGVSLKQTKSIIHLAGFQYVMQKGGKFFPELNFEREILFRDIPAVLIFYVSPYIRTRLQEDAPDFWDWVTYWFTFKGIQSGALNSEAQWNKEVDRVNKLLSGSIPSKSEGFRREEGEEIHRLMDEVQRLENESTDDPNYWQLLTPLLIKLGRLERKYYRFHYAVNHFKKAIAYLQRLAILDSKFNEGVGDTLMDLGHAYLSQKNYKEAEKAYQQALDYLPESKKKDVFHQKGVIFQYQEKYSEALTFMLKVLKMAIRDNDPISHARTLHSIGMQYQFLKDYDSALTYFDRSIIEFEETEQSSHIKRSLFHKAQVYLEDDKPDLSRSAIHEALRLSRAEGDTFLEAKMSTDYGTSLYIKENYIQAERYFLKAIQLFEELKIGFELLKTFELLGLTYQKLEEPQKAIRTFEEGLQLALQLFVPEMASRFTFKLQALKQ